jgi:fructose-1,6-bisphosphatase/sedoheptulose 1,7-bisphosphatase-like protein
MPGVRATIDPHRFDAYPMIVVGRGGYEEGTMTAAAARALGGFMQAKEFNPNPSLNASARVLRLEEDLVPADPRTTLVSATFITPDNDWFQQPGITPTPSGFSVTTMVVTHHGVEFFEAVLDRKILHGSPSLHC